MNLLSATERVNIGNALASHVHKLRASPPWLGHVLVHNAPIYLCAQKLNTTLIQYKSMSYK
jgi:hypothetical protein